jgi:hypothetical protein
VNYATTNLYYAINTTLLLLILEVHSETTMTQNKGNTLRKLLTSLLKFFSGKRHDAPLELIRVTEKFDVVFRPPFRSGFIKPE